MIFPADIRALDAQLNPRMEAANSAVIACKALSPTDVADWGGFYAAWTAIHKQWTGTDASLLWGINVGGVLVADYFAEDIYNNMLNFQKRLKQTWQAKIHAACPDYTPPSDDILVKPPASDRTGELIDKAIVLGEVVGGIAAAGLIAGIVFKTIRFIKG